MSVTKINSAYHLVLYFNKKDHFNISRRLTTGDEFLSFVRPFKDYDQPITIETNRFLNNIQRSINYNYAIDLMIYLVERLNPDIEREIRERVKKRYQHLHSSDKQKCSNLVTFFNRMENLREMNDVKPFQDFDDDRDFDRHQMGTYGYITPWIRFTSFGFSMKRNFGTLTLEVHKNLEGQAFIAVYLRSIDLRFLLETNNERKTWKGTVSTKFSEEHIIPVSIPIVRIEIIKNEDQIIELTVKERC